MLERGVHVAGAGRGELLGERGCGRGTVVGAECRVRAGGGVAGIGVGRAHEARQSDGGALVDEGAVGRGVLERAGEGCDGAAGLRVEHDAGELLEGVDGVRQHSAMGAVGVLGDLLGGGGAHPGLAVAEEARDELVGGVPRGRERGARCCGADEGVGTAGEALDEGAVGVVVAVGGRAQRAQGEGAVVVVGGVVVDEGDEGVEEGVGAQPARGLQHGAAQGRVPGAHMGAHELGGVVAAAQHVDGAGAGGGVGRTESAEEAGALEVGVQIAGVGVGGVAPAGERGGRGLGDERVVVAGELQERVARVLGPDLRQRVGGGSANEGVGLPRHAGEEVGDTRRVARLERRGGAAERDGGEVGVGVREGLGRVEQGGERCARGEHGQRAHSEAADERVVEADGVGERRDGAVAQRDELVARRIVEDAPLGELGEETVGAAGDVVAVGHRGHMHRRRGDRRTVSVGARQCQARDAASGP